MHGIIFGIRYSDPHIGMVFRKPRVLRSRIFRQLLTTADELELYAAPDGFHFPKPTTTRTITADDIMIDGRFGLFPENDDESILYKVRSEKES